jgi:hypothetical protein
MSELPRQSRFMEIQEYLEQVVKLPESSAIEYAEGLIEDGFDSIELFDVLTVEELRRDCGFKIGHAKQVEKSQKERGVGRFAVRHDAYSLRSPQVGQPLGYVHTCSSAIIPASTLSVIYHYRFATGPSCLMEVTSIFAWTRSSAKEPVAWCTRPS